MTDTFEVFFTDKEHEPKAAELAALLGRAGARWDELRALVAEEYAPLDVAWAWGGKRWGWTLRLKRKKRAVLYMTPAQRHFRVGFALGEKAVRAARAVELPAELMQVIQNAPQFAEGRAVRLEVRTKADIANVLRIAAIKMAN